MTNERMKATCHPDRPAKAKGLCESCYVMARRAEKKAEARAKEIEAAPVPDDDSPDTSGIVGFPDDKAAELRLKQILWGWIEEGEKATVITDSDGNRDYKTEVRLRDMKDQKAMKAATILGRGLISEKEKDKAVPEELPGQADLMSFAKGWMAAATSSPTPRQRAQGGLTSSSDDGNDDNVFDA